MPPPLKLFMLLLGCKPPGRHTEQHDIFFGIGTTLRDLVPEITTFWPGPQRIHIDAWREVTQVEDFSIHVVPKTDPAEGNGHKLFFINLGGYQENRFEEQHYVLLTVKADKTSAIGQAKETFFFKHNHFENANSHIDDKYGIDVDDLYEIEEMLSSGQKEKYRIEILPSPGKTEDQLSLGYVKLGSL